MAERSPNIRPREAAGFTLTELLISVSILALLVVMISQLVNSATAVMTLGRKGFDADAQARLVFDRLASDFSRMARRSDLDFYGKDTSAGRPMNGNDQLAFYAAVPGYYSSPTPAPTPTRNERSPMSVVAYCMSNDPNGRPQLVRLAKGLVWEPKDGWPEVAYRPLQLVAVPPAGRWPNLFQPATSGPAPFNGMADTDFEAISDSVVRFEYCYLLNPTSTAAATVSTAPYNAALPGHTSRDFHRDVAAIVVTIAVLDPTSRVIVSDYSQLTSPTLFPDATAMEIAPSWVAAINQPAFAATARIPQTAASAVRVYQRRFSFTTGATD